MEVHHKTEHLGSAYNLNVLHLLGRQKAMVDVHGRVKVDLLFEGRSEVKKGCVALVTARQQVLVWNHLCGVTGRKKLQRDKKIIGDKSIRNNETNK